MPPNKVWQSDIETTIQYSRWFLQFLGVWAMVSRTSSQFDKTISKFFVVAYLIFMAYPLLPTLMDTFLRQTITIVKIIRIGPVGAILTSIFKYLYIVLRCKSIKLSLEQIEYDWMQVDNENEREIMTRNAKLGRGLTVISCVFMYIGAVFYQILMPIMKGNTINARNETVKPMVYPGFDMFFDLQNNRTYEIVFGTNAAAAFIRYTVTIASCNLAAVFVCHACGQIQVLMSRLERLFDEIDDEKENSEELQERISSVIHCHVRVLRLSTRIDHIMREICLIEVLNATFLIILIEYSAVTGLANSEIVTIITFGVLLFSYSFNIFILCYIGELLQEQCYEVGTSTYLIDWYKLPGKTGLAIVMILAMASYPRKITAGGMIDLSIANFGAIIKTTVVYSNMIRTMAD
nr:olfactory receptor 24 [Gregopimpla kuwanae]